MPDTPRLQEHQQETLRAELATERYDGLSADEAYAEVTARPNALRLARTNYIDAEALDRIPEGTTDEEKQAAREQRKAIKNIPGFPNKVRRSDFDIVWNETT